MRAAHVVFQRDRRSPAELLEAWPTLTQVAAAVRNSGVDVSIVQIHEQSARETRCGVDVHFGPDPYALLRQLAPDILHVHGLHFTRETRALHKHFPDSPVLIQDHGGGTPGRWRQRWMRYGLRHVRAAAFTAREQAKAYRTALPEGARIVEVLENSTDFTPGDPQAARKQTGLFGDPCVLWIGRLIAGKDPLTALDAVARAALELPDLQLWCCYGNNELEERMRARIASDARLGSRVHLLGRVAHDQVELLCRAADIFLSTSLAESTGYALIESLACGATPVITELPAHRAITANGAVGALFPLRSADAAAETLTRVARQNRRDLLTRAIAHFQENLTYDVIGRRLRRIYEELSA